jgi:hypothetical protein
MPGQTRLAGALAAVVMAVAISACGSSADRNISAADSQKLLSELDAVQGAVNSRNCGLAQARAQDFIDAVNALPETVGTDDKEKLREAGQNLQTLASDPSQCRPELTTGPSGVAGVRPDDTTSTTTAATTTSTTTTSTSTTEAEPPPDTGGGNAQGGGGSGQTGGGEVGGAGVPAGGGSGGEVGGGAVGGGSGGEVGGGSGDTGTGGTGTGGTG